MKILHVNYIFPPVLEIADGVTNVVYNVTQELAKNKLEITVFTSDRLELKGSRRIKSMDTSIRNISINYFSSILARGTIIITPGITFSLLKKVQKFDIIHIHDIRSFQGLMAAIIATKKKVPYIYQPHGSFFSVPPKSTIKKFARFIMDNLIANKLVRNAAKILALNSTEYNLFKKYLGIPSDKIVILPNGLDTKKYTRKTSDQFGGKNNLRTQNIILYLGRINRLKGIDLLLKSFSILLKSYPISATLVLAGPDDGYLSETIKLAKCLEISKCVQIMGFLTEIEKLEVLSSASIFVLPSFTGFPITFLEACALGVPIITTTLGDSLEWIDGNVGIVTSPNPEELAAAIYNLLSNEPLRLTMAKNCIETVTMEFTIESVVKKLLAVYREIVESSIKGENE